MTRQRVTRFGVRGRVVVVSCLEDGNIRVEFHCASQAAGGFARETTAERPSNSISVTVRRVTIPAWRGLIAAISHICPSMSSTRSSSVKIPDLAHLCELVNSETVSTNFGYHGILGRGLRAFQDIVLSFLAQEGMETRFIPRPPGPLRRC